MTVKARARQQVCTYRELVRLAEQVSTRLGQSHHGPRSGSHQDARAGRSRTTTRWPTRVLSQARRRVLRGGEYIVADGTEGSDGGALERLVCPPSTVTSATPCFFFVSAAPPR